MFATLIRFILENKVVTFTRPPVQIGWGVTTVPFASRIKASVMMGSAIPPFSASVPAETRAAEGTENTKIVNERIVAFDNSTQIQCAYHTSQQGINIMRYSKLLATLILGATFIAACGTKDDASQEHMNTKNNTTNGEQMESTQRDMMSNDEWVRSDPVDVAMIDKNKDEHVYQCQMDWNVIADEEGTCPKCNMVMEKVGTDEVVKKLKDHGFKVK